MQTADNFPEKVAGKNSSMTFWNIFLFFFFFGGRGVGEKQFDIS